MEETVISALANLLAAFSGNAIGLHLHKRYEEEQPDKGSVRIGAILLVAGTLGAYFMAPALAHLYFQEMPEADFPALTFLVGLVLLLATRATFKVVAYLLEKPKRVIDILIRAAGGTPKKEDE